MKSTSGAKFQASRLKHINQIQLLLAKTLSLWTVETLLNKSLYLSIKVFYLVQDQETKEMK